MKIKVSKDQWESVGIKNGWIKKEAYLMPSGVLTPELEKQLKKLSISFNKGEISWDNVTSQIIGLTQDQPKIRDVALKMTVDFVTRLTKAEQPKELAFSSKKTFLKKIAMELNYEMLGNIVNEPKNVYDASTGETIDMSQLSLEDLVALYNGEWFELSPEDYNKVEAEVVSRQADSAERASDAMKDRKIMNEMSLKK